jgi:N-acetylglucosamine-6-sulfatase
MKGKMKRSTFLLGVGGAAALASFRLSASEAAQTGTRNVLWVITDDQPQYMMESMPLTTQNIRDLGIDFTLGSADIPLCGPARVSLLTGLSVTTHKCDTNETTWSKFLSSPLGLQDRTVACYVKTEAGYATGHFGKYVNGYASDGRVPPHWDRWGATRGDASDAGGNLETPNQVNEDGTWVDLTGEPTSVWAAKRCAEFVREHVNSPWFAQYCPSIPHAPYFPSPESEHLFDGAMRDASVTSVNEADMSDKPTWMRNRPLADIDAVQAEYEGKLEELADLDSKGMDPILAALEETGQLANTVIFFTSDNGYLHAEHRLRKKDRPYWESSEVPFFVKGPGVRSATTRDTLVNHTDLLPTTCEIAGVSLPSDKPVDGRSMLSYLGADSFSNWRTRMLITSSNDVGPQENPGGSNEPSGRWWLLREGDLVFILRENGTKELYTMGSDPYQERSTHRTADPALIQRLVTSVKKMRAASGEARRELEE